MGPFRTPGKCEGISYHERDVCAEKLLMQHGDMSGTWIAEQKEIIKPMGMKLE